ncbi:MAG TPA: site-specific integrase, partial [Thermodesulfobacteriota bacterium]
MIESSAMRGAEAALDRYLTHLTVERGLARHTLEAYSRDLLSFLDAAAAARGCKEPPPPSDLDRTDVLAFLKAQSARGLSARSVARQMSAVRGFVAFLRREGTLGIDPTADLAPPRQGRTLPRSLTAAEVRRLLEAPSGDDPIALRDRAMLELLYASGLRVSELVALPILRVDLAHRIVRPLGKGSKERLVPFGRSAEAALRAYLDRGRPALLARARPRRRRRAPAVVGGEAAGRRRVPRPRPETLCFLGRGGQGLSRQAAWAIIRGHAR